jgi:hypothetical protein
MVRRWKTRTCREVGGFFQTASPMTRREKWSTTTATHQQNGQICGNANGSQVAQ